MSIKEKTENETNLLTTTRNNYNIQRTQFRIKTNPQYHDNYDKCKLDTVELNFQIIEMNQTVFAK